MQIALVARSKIHVFGDVASFGFPRNIMLLPKCRKRKTLAYFLSVNDYAFDRTDRKSSGKFFTRVPTYSTNIARRGAHNIIRVATTDNSMRQSACGPRNVRCAFNKSF